MKNCWTCAHDILPPRGITGHACARLEEEVEPPEVRAWVERTWLDSDTQMPRKNAADCPGWKAKEGE